jgi:hypothetical protein
MPDRAEVVSQHADSDGPTARVTREVGHVALNFCVEVNPPSFCELEQCDSGECFGDAGDAERHVGISRRVRLQIRKAAGLAKYGLSAVANADANGGVLLSGLELRDYPPKSGCGIGAGRSRLGTLTGNSRKGFVGRNGRMGAPDRERGSQHLRYGEACADPTGH